VCTENLIRLMIVKLYDWCKGAYEVNPSSSAVTLSSKNTGWVFLS